MCPEIRSKRIYCIIFQIWGLYFAFSLSSGSWTLFQGCDSPCSNWLFHAQPVLPVLVSCRSSCASHLVGPSWTNVNKFSDTLQKSQLLVSCHVVFAEGVRAVIDPLREQWSDPETSSHCLKKASSTFSLWCDVVRAFCILQTPTTSGSLSSVPGPLCTPFLWQQDLRCSFFLFTPEQVASPETECSCLLLILLVSNSSAALVGNGTEALSACVWWIFSKQVLSSTAADTTPLGTPYGLKAWSWLSITQVQSLSLSRGCITICVASRLIYQYWNSSFSAHLYAKERYVEMLSLTFHLFFIFLSCQLQTLSAEIFFLNLLSGMVLPSWWP